MAETAATCNGADVFRSSARVRADRADDVGLTTAQAARDREDSEAFAGGQLPDDLARVLQTHADLERQTGGTKTPLVAGQHPAESGDNGPSAVRCSQP